MTFIEIIILVVLEKKYDDNNKLILNSIARTTAGDDVRDRNRRACRRVYKEKKSSLCIVCGL